MILPIRKIGDPILEKPCKEVEMPVGDYTWPNHFFIQNMIETARFHDAVGLAANQVGENLRIFVFKKYPNAQRPSLKNVSSWEVAINPKIINFGNKVEYDEEGCLSVPKISAIVPRYKTLTMERFDEKGEKLEVAATGMLARVWQHELDHLNGINMLERASKIYYRK